jgi:hypothetical protein
MKLSDAAITFTIETDVIPAGFRPLTDLPLVIVVGLTGVGKSTVLELLPANGLNFTLLPNRRQLTDQIIMASLQAEAGERPHPITDRVERFEYTARYRAKFPGGMAHALSRVAVNPTQVQSFLIFDGLRGLNEVQHAVDYFPQAHFIVLDAPDTIRLNRLLQRGDSFDTTNTTGESLPAGEDMAAFLAVPRVETVFSAEQLQQIAGMAQAAQIPLDEVVQKVSIIVKERHNYDSGAAREYLAQTLPPSKVRVIDTSIDPASEIARKVVEWLKLPKFKP